MRFPIRLTGEASVIVLLTLLAGAIWAFAELTDEVLEGDTGSFDRRVLLALRDADDLADPYGPEWLEEMGRDFTALGGVAVLSLVTLAGCAYELMRGSWRSALLILAAVVGALVISQLLKGTFDRPRPDLVPHGSYVYTSSFPSGHSMLSAATYLTLAGIFSLSRPERWAKAYWVGVAVLITGLVGISRVYLGVHWPTDVLAGWFGGGAWSIVVLLVARRLLRPSDAGPATATA